MKTLILVLIVVSFLQATIAPYDVVLIILICRSFIRSGKTNLYLAFSFGLFLAHLNLISLGLLPIIFLTFVQITEGLSKSRLANNPLLIIPICFVLLSLNKIILSIFGINSLSFLAIFIESILSLPILYIVRFWEERFIVRKEIRLRL